MSWADTFSPRHAVISICFCGLALVAGVSFLYLMFVFPQPAWGFLIFAHAAAFVSTGLGSSCHASLCAWSIGERHQRKR